MIWASIHRKRNKRFYFPDHLALGPTPLRLFSRKNQGFFRREYSGRGMNFTTHLHLDLRLREWSSNSNLPMPLWVISYHVISYHVICHIIYHITSHHIILYCIILYIYYITMWVFYVSIYQNLWNDWKETCRIADTTSKYREWNIHTTIFIDSLTLKMKAIQSLETLIFAGRNGPTSQKI
jgi:hypothetical protein